MAFPVMTTGINNSIVFGSYSNALDYLTQSQRSDRNQGKEPSAAHVLAAGCFSGFVQVFVCAPIDLVKVRLQGQTTTARYRGPVHCVATILKEEGPRGLFRGGMALAMRDIPCYGLYFLPYEVTRKALTESGKEPGGCQRYICNTDGGRRGGRGDLGLRHAHGRGQSPAPDVGGRRAGVQRGPPLHESELQRGGSEGLLQRPYPEQPEGLPRQRCHLPHLREFHETFLSPEEMTSLKA
ncbi:solute carrier family 25 member 45 isoform X3 [Notothenia coriiceps]|nr:PREDICTED: solute carrier family 25 member 45 isoform X3 [Notothenia coriiceps]